MYEITYFVSTGVVKHSVPMHSCMCIDFKPIYCNSSYAVVHLRV